jgi:hypothetical protein
MASENVALRKHIGILEKQRTDLEIESNKKHID